ncbi:MAG: hypothetical protein ACT4PV_07935 [Planctomycetaceae bacterium]
MKQASPAAWLALAFRSPLTLEQKRALAIGAGPRDEEFEPALLEREARDWRALEEQGISLLTIADEAYPERLRAGPAPLLLLLAGRASLLEERDARVVAGVRGAAGEALMETLDGGGRAVAVLSKGLLSARNLLRALHEPIAEGSLLLVSAEPPRAAWGPSRDARRAKIVAALSG